MDWIERTKGGALVWLMDQPDPSVTYLTQTQAIGVDPAREDSVALRQRVLDSRPVRRILDAQYPDGYWVAPGIGYSPKYRASVWQLISLAQLGAPRCEAVDRAVEWLFRDNQREDGAFLSSRHTADSEVLCLNGNLVWSLGELGYGTDPRTRRAMEWLARQASASGQACRWNDGLPCTWGAVKTLRALAAVPPGVRPPGAESAVASAADLLLSGDMVRGDYPSWRTPSDRWHKPGYPLGYHSDALEAAVVLAEAGFASHPRVQRVVEWLIGLEDEEGFWRQRYVLEKGWAGFGQKGNPSPWVTIQALRLVRITT